MRNLLIVFFIICLFFLIILFPFKTRMMGHINLVEMKCYYSIKSWILKLLCGKIYIENGKLEMLNEDTLLSKNYNKKFMKIMTNEVLSKIDVKKVEIFFTGGFKENSFSSAIMCGTVLSLVQTLFGYLSLKFDDVKMYEDIDTTFDETSLELTLDVVVSISLFKLVICFLNSGNKIKKLKEIKNEG